MYIILKRKDENSKEQEIITAVENENLANNFCVWGNFQEMLSRSPVVYLYQKAENEDMKVAAYLEERKEAFDALIDLDAKLKALGEKKKNPEEEKNCEKKA